MNMMRERTSRLEKMGPDTWAESEKILRANGYAGIAWRWGAPSPDGAWCVHQPQGGDPKAGVGVICVPPPRYDHGARDVPDPDMRVAALEIDVRDKIANAAIDEFMDSRLRWPAGCDYRHRHNPIRIAADRTSLRPFQLEGRPFFQLRSRSFILAGDHPGVYGYQRHCVRWLCAESAICVSGLDATSREPSKTPYVWQRGSPLTVLRSHLPIIDAETARDLLVSIEAALENHR
jgi:hypothetical protein